MLDAFRDGGEASRSRSRCTSRGRRTEEEALRIAHDQWRTNVFSPPLCWDLATVEQFDEAATHVRPEDLHGAGADLLRPRAARRLDRRAAPRSGFDAIYLHHVGQEQRRFIEAFGEHVLPAAVRRKATSDLWWKNAVVYCLDVETFLDSDGDGCGDLVGLTERHRLPRRHRRQRACG